MTTSAGSLPNGDLFNFCPSSDTEASERVATRIKHVLIVLCTGDLQSLAITIIITNVVKMSIETSKMNCVSAVARAPNNMASTMKCIGL